MCPCQEAHAFREIRKLMAKSVRWFNKNHNDEDLIYDEAWSEFMELSRGSCAEILKLLAKDWDGVDRL